jgi:hypothetical protein
MKYASYFTVAILLLGVLTECRSLGTRQYPEEWSRTNRTRWDTSYDMADCSERFLFSPKLYRQCMKDKGYLLLNDKTDDDKGEN